MAPRGDVDEGYGWFLGTQLTEPDCVVLVAEVDAQVVGYVYAGLEPMSWKELREPAGFIHDVVVDESQRGRGIATELVEAAARWLKEHGAPRVMLWTASQNPAAQRLFGRLGFRTTMLEMTREAGDQRVAAVTGGSSSAVSFATRPSASSSLSIPAGEVSK